MPQVTTDQALTLAQTELQAGRAPQAESICRQILSREPQNVGAIQLLARIAFMSGHADAAVQLLRQAISLQPSNPQNYGNLASVLSQTGRAEDAIPVFQQALAINPSSVETYANLASALLALKRVDEAIDACNRALKVNPKFVGALVNLSNALWAKGDLESAIHANRRALQLQPNLSEAHNNLGNLLRKLGRLAEALQCFKQYVKACPDVPEAYAGHAATLLEMGHIPESIQEFQALSRARPDYDKAAFGLGYACHTARRLDDAIAAYRSAVQINPKYADAWHNLGLLLAEKGDSSGAIEAYNHAIELNPDYLEAYNNLAVALLYQQRCVEVVELLTKVLQRQPNYAGALNNLAMAYEDLGRQDEALEAYRKALSLVPDEEVIGNNYGNALRESGRLVIAVDHFKSMLEKRPSALIAGNLVFAINAHPNYEPTAILDEYRNWERHYAAPLRGTPASHPNTPDPERRIRVGFVSGDFNQHPVGRFLQPLFVNHDVNRFEYFCYSEGRRHDVVTDILKARADHWFPTLGASDEQVISQIRADQIDILVDLAMHTKDNRLMIFARKPAPVQVTYLAYAGTTGLSAIDYRLTDVYLDPPGQHDELYVEKSVRLPHTYWCYEALAEASGMAPTMPRSGGITFGSLNNFWKVNPAVVEVWKEIFAQLPEARFIVHTREGSHRDELLAGLGIDRSRVRFEVRTDPARYFSLYQEIDVALDPFPYPGGTTTCDALYMGVPVVTLAGKTGVSRGGVSILSNIGLTELIADSKPEYVRKAVGIARDVAGRAQLRATLRSQMQASPLMNARQFTSDVEQALKWMWRQWCEGPAAR